MDNQSYKKNRNRLTTYHAEVITQQNFPDGVLGNLLQSINNGPKLKSDNNLYTYATQAGCWSFTATHLAYHFHEHLRTVAERLRDTRSTLLRPDHFNHNDYGGLITVNRDTFIDPRIPLGFLKPPYHVGSVVIPADLKMLGSIESSGNFNNVTITIQINPVTTQEVTQLVCTTPNGEQFTLTEFHPSAVQVREMQ